MGMLTAQTQVLRESLIKQIYEPKHLSSKMDKSSTQWEAAGELLTSLLRANKSS
ncbi:hypothetical protein [Paenibacillus glufosinatiresistens]|uniref:hypothetical protein n=1 Tax=Paenibacillus glufosinatiresistens TaxID=3070657 RepID=UPI00286E3E24|nr:hypothetical protein [Paenibacillus sp. YX.27]